MNRIKQTITALVLSSLLLSLSSFAQDEDWANQSIEALEEAAPSAHPMNLYLLAGKLHANGESERSLFWFYAGQIRYRFHLLANPDLDPSGDPALFGSLQELVGRPINQMAARNTDVWIQSIEEAIEWDKKHPNELTSKIDHASEYQEVHNGLAKLLDYIRENAENLEAPEK